MSTHLILIQCNVLLGKPASWHSLWHLNISATNHPPTAIQYGNTTPLMSSTEASNNILGRTKKHIKEPEVFPWPLNTPDINPTGTDSILSPQPQGPEDPLVRSWHKTLRVYSDASNVTFSDLPFWSFSVQHMCMYVLPFHALQVSRDPLNGLKNWGFTCKTEMVTIRS